MPIEYGNPAESVQYPDCKFRLAYFSYDDENQKIHIQKYYYLDLT
jgi:hypothetical protein